MGEEDEERAAKRRRVELDLQRVSSKEGKTGEQSENSQKSSDHVVGAAAAPATSVPATSSPDQAGAAPVPSGSGIPLSENTVGSAAENKFVENLLAAAEQVGPPFDPDEDLLPTPPDSDSDHHHADDSFLTATFAFQFWSGDSTCYGTTLFLRSVGELEYDVARTELNKGSLAFADAEHHEKFPLFTFVEEEELVSSNDLGGVGATPRSSSDVGGGAAASSSRSANEAAAMGAVTK